MSLIYLYFCIFGVKVPYKLYTQNLGKRRNYRPLFLKIYIELFHDKVDVICLVIVLRFKLSGLRHQREPLHITKMYYWSPH